MNLILVIIDTLRYDAIGANGGDIETPNLDRLASDSLCFDHAFCASYPTIPFRTDLMTGRTGSPFHVWKPLPHGAWTWVRALAEDRGYATQLIHDTPHLVNGGAASRSVAVSGTAASAWSRRRHFFSVFDPDWELQWRPDPADCALRRLGDTRDVASEHPEAVQNLHRRGLEEIARRGAPGGIVDWLRSGAEGDFPGGVPPFDGWPAPEGYVQYFQRLYEAD